MSLSKNTGEVEGKSKKKKKTKNRNNVHERKSNISTKDSAFDARPTIVLVQILGAKQRKGDRFSRTGLIGTDEAANDP